MIEVAELFGHADMGGQKIGFLVPLFRTRSSNALLVQRISRDGRVAGFVGIEPAQTPVTPVNIQAVAIGEEPIWSFAFSNGDVIEARDREFRAALQSRLDDPALMDRPLLSVEIAEFLGLPDQRLSAAVKAYTRLRTLGNAAAGSWRDLSILTPDLRRAVRQAGGDLAPIAKRLIAQTDGNLASIRSPILLTAGTKAKLAEVARTVLEKLAPLYPPSRTGWSIRIHFPDEGPRIAAPEAVVLIPDERDGEIRHYLEMDFGWRVDAYPLNQLSIFRNALTETRAAGFALVRGENPRIIREVAEMGGPRITPILTGTSSRFPLHGNNDLFDASDMHICVPATGLPGATRPTRTTSTIVRQVIAAALGAGDRIGSERLEGRWVFYRANGTGSSPRTDAFATLYDRLIANDLSSRQIFFMLGKERGARAPEVGERPLDMLFPGGILLHDRRTVATMIDAKSDVLMLLPVRQRDEADWEEHRRAIDQVLFARGWRAGMPKGGEDGVYEVDIPLRLRYLRIRPEPKLAPRWNIQALLDFDLRELDAVTLTGDAGPASILAGLEQRRELAINMRDLCASNGEAGIMSIFAGQFRRLASGQLHRARTHFAALLLNHAYRLGHVGFEGDGALHDALHGPELGNAVQLNWNRIRGAGDHVRARVRLVAGRTNEHLPAGSNLIPPFDLVLFPDGVALERPNAE
ncbi:MAG: hypothetical protein J7499_07010 [Sphingopyxis sp.]|nr:hypothetical protein [Sphingopyxis sp.]